MLEDSRMPSLRDKQIVQAKAQPAEQAEKPRQKRSNGGKVKVKVTNTDE